MNTATAYRIGDRFALQPEEKCAVAVTIALAEDVRIRSNTLGQQLIYKHGHPYGVTLTVAFALGWCWLLDGDPAERRPREEVSPGPK